MEKDPVYILYVPDMAKKLRKSESGIRAAVYRNSRSIPRPFKLGGRVAWVEADVDAWLEQQKQERKM